MDFLKHMRDLGKLLAVESEIASEYQNPSGIGDHRELSLIDILRDKLPKTLLVSKGEIIDSNGRQTPEFDIVVHYPSHTPNFLSLAGRNVIPVEDVLCVGEIKSQYNEERLQVCINNLEKLNALERYYRGTRLLNTINTTAMNKYMNTPISPNDKSGGAPPIISFFFSYKGLSDNTIIKHLNAIGRVPENFFGVFTLNQSQILLKDNVWTASPAKTKDNVLFWLFISIYGSYDTVKKSGREDFLEPDSDRYINSFVAPHIK
jgi:hypothetical protein